METKIAKYAIYINKKKYAKIPIRKNSEKLKYNNKV